MQNGHDLQIGHTLGMLLAHTDRQTRVLERILDRMEDMPTRLVAAIPPAPAPAPPPAPAPVQTSSGPLSRLLATLSFRDWVQLVMAAIIVIAALTGHVTLREAASLAGKPFGF